MRSSKQKMKSDLRGTASSDRAGEIVQKTLVQFDPVQVRETSRPLSIDAQMNDVGLVAATRHPVRELEASGRATGGKRGARGEKRENQTG
jgi:hypothetical protein